MQVCSIRRCCIEDADEYQAYSPVLPVGTQHYYKSSFDALATIFRAEGARGLVRGIDAAVLRTCMGSSVSAYRVICGRSLSYWSIGSITHLQLDEEPAYFKRNFTGRQYLDFSREQLCFWNVRGEYESSLTVLHWILMQDKACDDATSRYCTSNICRKERPSVLLYL